MRKILSVVSVAVTLGLFASAQNTVNTTRNAAGQRGTLNEDRPLMRALRKPAVGANVKQQLKSQVIPSLHIFRFATADYPGAAFTETTAVNNGVVVDNYSFGTGTLLIPFV